MGGVDERGSSDNNVRYVRQRMSGTTDLEAKKSLFNQSTTLHLHVLCVTEDLISETIRTYST